MNYPGHIGPFGLHDWTDRGQRSNGAFAAVPFIDYYEHTLDRPFLEQTAYPFLREVATFYMSYMVKVTEGGPTNTNGTGSNTSSNTSISNDTNRNNTDNKTDGNDATTASTTGGGGVGGGGGGGAQRAGGQGDGGGLAWLAWPRNLSLFASGALTCPKHSMDPAYCIVPRGLAARVCRSTRGCVAVMATTDDAWNGRFPGAAMLGAAPMAPMDGWVSYAVPPAGAPQTYMWSVPKSCSMEMCTLGGVGTVVQSDPALELSLVRRVLHSVLRWSASAYLALRQPSVGNFIIIISLASSRVRRASCGARAAQRA